MPGAQLLLPLDDAERAELRSCETTIERNLSAFIETGAALLIIKDSRLYRETHGSFEAYLADRWNMGKTSAYRLIKAAEVVAGIEHIGAPLSPIGEAITPQNEAQARPLAALPTEEERGEAWARAVETAGGQPTAAVVQAAVDGMLPPKDARDAVPPPESAQEPLFDADEAAAGSGFAPPGPAAAGEQAEGEAQERAGGMTDEGLTDEEWEASARPAASDPIASDPVVSTPVMAEADGAADAVSPLTPEGDAATSEAGSDAATAGLAATPMTRPEPAAPAPKPATPAPKAAAPAAPATPTAPAPPAAPALPPGWTTAMVKVADFEAAKALGLWPLVNAIGVVEDLRASLEDLRAALADAAKELEALRSAQKPGALTNHAEPFITEASPVVIETSPAMAIAAGAAGILADMIRTGAQEVLTPTDTQILDELFPAREQTLPEHIVAALLTKRLRQARGESQQG